MLLRKIKNSISNVSGNGTLFDELYLHAKYRTAIFLGKIWSEEHYARWFYHLYTGKKLNLREPRYFDEKIWWLKLNNRDPMLTKCSDKYAVREYVKSCGYENILVPQVDVFDDIKKLDFNRYSEEVVVKCNHNSGEHIFYDPANPMSKKELRIRMRKLNYIFRHNAYVLSHEWNYKNIPRKIIVEKVLRDKGGQLPVDYKFMCFDGSPRLLFLDIGLINNDKSYNHQYPRNIYDMNFQLLPVKETRPNTIYPIEKPQNFDTMVEIAKVLSKPFPFCRVDLYNIDGEIFFGEITFYHGGGCNNITPEEWDLKMGSWINLESPKIKKKASESSSKEG